MGSGASYRGVRHTDRKNSVRQGTTNKTDALLTGLPKQARVLPRLSHDHIIQDLETLTGFLDAVSGQFTILLFFGKGKILVIFFFKFQKKIFCLHMHFVYMS